MCSLGKFQVMSVPSCDEANFVYIHKVKKREAIKGTPNRGAGAVVFICKEAER